MRSFTTSLFLFLASALFSLHAAAGDFFYSFDIGSSDMGFNEEDFLDSSSAFVGDEADVSGSHALGYRFDNGIQLSGGVYVASNNYFFGYFTDSFGLVSLDLAAGYVIPVSESFFIVPKVGYSAWTLEVNEGTFIGDPADAESVKLDGGDTFYQLDLEWLVSSSTMVTLNYRETDYDFSTARNVGLGLKFLF